jgi:hypothetical protein
MIAKVDEIFENSKRMHNKNQNFQFDTRNTIAIFVA